MARRRGLTGGLAAMTASLANSAGQFGNYFMQQALWDERNKKTSHDDIVAQMLAHPEMADQLAESAKANWGLDLSGMVPSNERLSQPLHAAIHGAQEESAVPSVDTIIQSLKALGRPSMLTPGVKRGPFRPSQEGELPSTPFQPSAGPTMEGLLGAREGKLNAFKEQRAIDIAQKGDEAEAMGHGRITGEQTALTEQHPSMVTREKELSEAGALGRESPAVGAAEVANFEAMTPAAIKRAGGIAAVQERERSRNVANEELDKLPPEYRGAFEAATALIPATRRPAAVREMARLWELGDETTLKERIKQYALAAENVDARNRVRGRQETIRALRDAEVIIKEARAAGVPFDWAHGTAENLARVFGKTTNPRYVRLRQRLSDALINYRRAATGVQFSVRESRDYQAMFANYKNDVPVNAELIRGLYDSMRANDRVYWEQRLGPAGADLVGVPDPRTDPLLSGVAYTDYLNAVGGEKK